MDAHLPDNMLFDDQARTIANRDIEEYIDKFADGRTDFPAAEVLALACDVLLIMGGIQGDPEGRRLVAVLTSPRGVSYASVVPLMTVLRHRANLAIDRAHANRITEVQRVAMDDRDFPF